jgi:hypothetical protein
MNMNTKFVTLELPASLYEKLQTLATEEHTNPVDIITELITEAYQHRGWLQDLTALRQQIQDEGGLQLDSSKEEIIAQLRQTRQDFFETEYAHLYR